MWQNIDKRKEITPKELKSRRGPPTEKEDRAKSSAVRLETGVGSLSDPERDFGELIRNGCNPTSLRKKATDLEDKLSSLDALKQELVALEGDRALRWEKLMKDEARPRGRAAMLRVEKALKDVVPTPAAIIPPSGNKGTTKKRKL